LLSIRISDKIMNQEQIYELVCGALAVIILISFAFYFIL
jgi:hypothetical protein